MRVEVSRFGLEASEGKDRGEEGGRASARAEVAALVDERVHARLQRRLFPLQLQFCKSQFPHKTVNLIF